jgi:hypothetical protein
MPTNFRGVVEATLKEFFKRILLHFDAERSWKKPIYKVVALFDDPIPEYFKTPSFFGTIKVKIFFSERPNMGQ